MNISIDNDIMYLLREIGHNIKINNVVAKGIINNSSLEKTFDDKKLITHEEIRRGYYVEYNNLFFIAINEVNDKRYNTYYKGLIRRCNYSIKFILNNKLYEFPVIIEGEKFQVINGQFLSLAGDVLTITLPYNDKTRHIARQQRFVKFGQVFKIDGIDYTKGGLMILICKVDGINTSNDDMKNEIADRYKDSKDILNGNTTPEPLFGEGNPPEEPTEPEEPPVEDNFTIEIAGETEIRLGETKTYTATVKNNGAIVEGKAVKWTIENKSSPTIVTTMDTTDNSITLKASEKFDDMGEFKLVVKLADDESISAEMWIEVIGLW